MRPESQTGYPRVTAFAETRKRGATLPRASAGCKPSVPPHPLRCFGQRAVPSPCTVNKAALSRSRSLQKNRKARTHSIALLQPSLPHAREARIPRPKTLPAGTGTPCAGCG